jgi:hypothetical protein
LLRCHGGRADRGIVRIQGGEQGLKLGGGR